MSINKIDSLLEKVRIKLSEWLDGNPTGSFSVIISTNQGGIRGEPDVEIKEKLK